MHQYVGPHQPCFHRVYGPVEEIKESNNSNTRHHTEWTTRLQEFGKRSALGGGALPQYQMPAPLKGSVCHVHSGSCSPVQSPPLCSLLQILPPAWPAAWDWGLSDMPPGLCPCDSSHLGHPDLPCESSASFRLEQEPLLLPQAGRLSSRRENASEAIFYPS